MTRPRTAAMIVAVLGALAAGCGSSSDPEPAASGRTSTTTVDPRQQLEAAVRDAIRRDYDESLRSLWTNRIPAHPVASAGPAFKEWRKAVADRRRAGIRVRSLSDELHIVSVRLDPSYQTATARIRADQRAQLIRNGRPSGKPSVAHERVRMILHRRGSRFVVWRVEVQDR